jgi:aspartyl-tRNA(Asn)/glutamyl-tRNA(Gln) amidotransferase subunit C
MANSPKRKTKAKPGPKAQKNSQGSISKETVRYVAGLARLELEDKELEQLSGQLQEILGFIDKLKKLDLKDISPTSHILPIKNVLREDQPQASLPVEKVLSNAPQRQGNFFIVPKVIE